MLEEAKSAIQEWNQVNDFKDEYSSLGKNKESSTSSQPKAHDPLTAKTSSNKTTGEKDTSNHSSTGGGSTTQQRLTSKGLVTPPPHQIKSPNIAVTSSD